MRAGAHFKIEFQTTSDQRIHTNNLLEHEEDVLAFAENKLCGESELCVACLKGSVDYGNFIISVAAGMTTEIRAHEHRGFLVKNTTIDQALCALAYWLPLQERAPNFKWEEE